MKKRKRTLTEIEWCKVHQFSQMVRCIPCPFVRDGLWGEYGILLPVEVKFAHDFGWIGGEYSFDFFVETSNWVKKDIVALERHKTNRISKPCNLKFQAQFDVGLQRFVRCASSERGHIQTQQVRQAQVRASRSLNFEGVVQYREVVDIVLFLNGFQNF